MDGVTFGRYPGDTARIIFAPLFIGVARGYFRDAGIEVSISEPPDHPWSAVANDEADCGAGFVDYCVAPKYRGRIKAVAVHEQFRHGHGLTALLGRRVLVDQGALGDYASLRGKTIGLLGGRGDDYLAYYGALRQGGLTIDDVHVVPVPHAGAERERALRNGEIDLMIGRRPRHVVEEVREGLVSVWKVGDEVHPDLQARYIVYSTRFMHDRPHVGVRFLTAYLRGARDYRDAFDKGIGRDAMVELLARETGETPELLTTMKPIGFSPNGVVDLDRLAVETAAMAERGLVPTDTQLSDMVDNRFAEAAVRELGAYG
jgi:NitT/TauT family transport system substrate-binding protein